MPNIHLDELNKIFSDKPDLLKLLDPRNMDLDSIEGSVAADELRIGEGFATPVNFYVTGRTSAGKSSLGNRLLDPNQPVMKSTGHINCTDRVGCFQLKANLRYFDLPGAGARESFENINRAALLIEQIENKRARMFKINDFTLSDYTKYTKENKSIDEKVTVEQWQSEGNQKLYAPDVVLYIVAPHMGFSRDDETYLWDLLNAKKYLGRNTTVFALNLHLSEDGKTPKYTHQNIEDAQKIIGDIYKDFYSEMPSIVQINSLSGAGVNKVTQEICKILPVEKLGKMEQVLDSKLKGIANTIRSNRYMTALIHIASRLATRKVDEQHGDQDLLLEVYAATYAYGIKIFKREDAPENLYGIVDNLAREAKEAREQKVTVQEAVYETRELTTTQQVPQYGPREITRTVAVPETYIHREERKSFGGLSQIIMGPKEIVMTRPKIEEVTETDYGIIGMEEQEVSLGKIREVVDTKEKVVGVNYLKGGYFVIEGILAIGLGIENASSQKTDFNSIFQAGKQVVESKLAPQKNRIESIVDNHKLRQAEAELIKVLSNALIK